MQYNLEISRLSLPCVPQMASFSRSKYVCENQGCPTIAKFLFGCAGLGNRAPRPGRNRTKICSLCKGHLNEAHVAFLCPDMDNYRYHHTDIAVFKMMCQTKQITPLLAYKWYVTGLDWNGNPVHSTVYLKRGCILENIVNEWLDRTWILDGIYDLRIFVSALFLSLLLLHFSPLTLVHLDHLSFRNSSIFDAKLGLTFVLLPNYKTWN